MDALNQIREKEKQSHMNVYLNHELYQGGSWLEKPVKTVMDILPLFDGKKEIHILDLGCGVGRNSVAIAEYFQNVSCRIDCVDILPLAIDKLLEYADSYGVSDRINGIVQPLESYPITEHTYDLILAVSALEHVDSESSFVRKLAEIRDGVCAGGIVCLIINANVREFDKKTGHQVPAQFEVNLEKHRLQSLLQRTFDGWKVLKSGFRDQRYDIPRGETVSDLHTSVMTYVARKTDK